MTSQVEHARAHEAMRSLEAAKAQRQTNEHLRNDFLDSEDALVHHHQQFFSYKLQQQMHHTREAADALRQAFETQLSFSETCKKPPYQRYMEDCHLSVQAEELALPSHYDEHRATRRLREEISDWHTAIHDIGCDEIYDRVLLLTGRCEKVVDAARATTTPFADLVGQVTGAANQAFRLRAIQVPLQKLVEEVKRLSDVNRSVAALQQQSLENGDIAANEGLMLERVTLMEAISDLITHKFHLLDEEESVTLASIDRQIGEASVAVTTRLEGMHRSLQSQQERLQGDLKNVREATRRADHDEEIARGGFERELAQSNALLEQNARESDELWKQMHELEKKLQRLAVQRRGEIDKRVKLFEREERRHVDMSHFRSFASEHTEKLVAASRAVEADELLTDMMREILRGVEVLGQQKLAQHRKSILEERRLALEEHLAHFREQYLHLGELLFKKERSLEELVQRSVYARAQQELAMDSFNPRAKEFASLKGDIDVAVEKTTSEIQTLQNKATLYVQAFKPTEKGLQAEGRTFEHPVTELVHLNKEKSRKIAAFHAFEVSQKNALAAGTTLEGTTRRLQEDQDALEQARRQAKSLRVPPAPGRALPQPPVENCLKALD